MPLFSGPDSEEREQQIQNKALEAGTGLNSGFTMKASLTHTKELLSVTFCNTTAGVRVSFQTKGNRQTDGTHGRTNRQGI